MRERDAVLFISEWEARNYTRNAFQKNAEAETDHNSRGARCRAVPACRRRVGRHTWRLYEGTRTASQHRIQEQSSVVHTKKPVHTRGGSRAKGVEQTKPTHTRPPCRSRWRGVGGECAPIGRRRRPRKRGWTKRSTHPKVWRQKPAVTRVLKRHRYTLAILPHTHAPARRGEAGGGGGIQRTSAVFFLYAPGGKLGERVPRVPKNEEAETATAGGRAVAQRPCVNGGRGETRGALIKAPGGVSVPHPGAKLRIYTKRARPHTRWRQG